MSSNYWTVREAVEHAANVWFSKELLDINASIDLSSTLQPKMGPYYFRELERQAAEIKRRFEDAALIRNEAWLKLKNDLGSGKLRASALPCQQSSPFHLHGNNPIEVRPSFWEREDLSESSLGKPYPFGISSSPHLVLISEEELRKYLHPENLPIEATSAGSKNDLNAKLRRRGGRKPIHDWDKIEAKAYGLMDQRGDFNPHNDKWNSQACLVRALLDFCQQTFRREPSDSSLKAKAKIPEWLKKWRAKKSAVRN